MIFGVFGMLLGVAFRTLGSSKMGVSCRRNTDFHKIDLPKSHSKNKSPQRSDNSNFGVNFGPILRAFLVKNATRNQVKKGVDKKLEKSGPKEGWGRLARGRREHFLSQTACWGGRGGTIKNQNQLAHYLTRPWAKGPANIPKGPKTCFLFTNRYENLVSMY